MQDYWKKEHLPYPGIPDPEKDVLGQLGQEFKLLKFGRMPAVIVVQSGGHVHHAHYGNNAGDIPENKDVLAMLDGLNANNG